MWKMVLPILKPKRFCSVKFSALFKAYASVSHTAASSRTIIYIKAILDIHERYNYSVFENRFERPNIVINTYD